MPDLAQSKHKVTGFRRTLYSAFQAVGMEPNVNGTSKKQAYAY
ncbi:MAG: hypothetical protein Ct9H300mP27_07620 [Chloroflexota bacterium]|nr:MAG: hypothetical protein Ct9H300mP27_07620 [Chloroflexota bacterium]